jgi:hypothetical protein
LKNLEALHALKHVKALRTHLAERETAHAKLHKEAMDCEEEGSTTHTFHKGAMEQCMKDAGHHVEQAKTISDAMNRKAAGLSDDDELEPTRVSAIAPDAPLVRAVARPGMRELPAENNPLYQKIFGTDEVG